nr:hypothetical protein [Tanacetum cinerariifolium]
MLIPHALCCKLENYIEDDAPDPHLHVKNEYEPGDQEFRRAGPSCITWATNLGHAQNALQAMLPQIREEISEEFRTGSGLSNAGGNPTPVTIHTWLEL